jgi:TP901 family phage tail tape measure protein
MNISVAVLTAGALARIRALQSQLALLQSGIIAAGKADGPGNGRQLSQLAKYGNQLQWTGRQLQYNFSLPLALAGAAATHFALENEKAFTRIQKVYGDTTLSAQVMEEELGALRKAFVALSNHYGVHQAEVLNIAADWAAAGASGVALARGVEQTLITMVLGEMKAAEATESLIAIQAQYNLSSKELVDTIAKLNVVENQTGISLQGLIQGFARAAGVARSAGVDVEHLAAMLAALTPTAGSAAQAGNALKTIISRLASPTGEARDILEAMGVAVNDVAWKSANGSQKIELLARKFHELDDAQRGVVSATLASRYQINKFEALMDSVWKHIDNNVKTTGYYGRALEATADRVKYLDQAERELQAVLESNPQKFKQIWVILQNAMADIITPLIPLMLMAANTLKMLVEGFRNLPPEIQKAVVVGLLFLALFGPLLRYIGSTMTLIGELSWFFRGLGKSVLLLFAPFTAVGRMFLGLGTMAATAGQAIAAGFLAGSLRTIAIFRAMRVGIFSVFVGIVPFIFGIMREVTRIVTVFSLAIPMIMAQAHAASLRLWRAFSHALSAVALATAYTAGVAWRAGLALITVAQIAWNASITAAWVALRYVLIGVSAQMWTAITVVWSRAFTRLGTLFFAFVMFTGNMWRAMLMGMMAASVAFGRNIGAFFAALFTRLVPLIRAGSAALLAAITSPWGIAIAAVVAVLLVFQDQIAQAIRNIVNYFRNLPPNIAAAFQPIVNIFHSAVRAVLRGFNALPEGVHNALMAVVRIVAAAARAVYNLFSYLNPFATHSPSLVQNVTRGMAEVRKQFATITDIKGPIDAAYRDLKRFGNAVASLMAGMDKAQRVDQRINLAKVAPGALDEFDRLVKHIIALTQRLDQLDDAIKRQEDVVDGLRASLDSLSARLDVATQELDRLQGVANSASDSLNEAKQRLSDFANAPIQGMRAMSDQIFANEMAQKALRLEMMRMEDAVGGIDTLKGKLDALAGEIELLSGEQASLREGGAGSEILKQYDDQIKGLRDQQNTIKETVTEYDKLSDELEKLQRQGEILDLENSLQFDPLIRQIDQAANSMKELPFEEIMAGVQQSQADIARYTEEWERATEAVKRQQEVVDALKAERDAIQAQYDVEQQKLDELRDAYGEVEEAIRDINSALTDMSQAAEDSIRRAKEAAGGAGGSPALENFKGAAGGNFPDVGGAGGLGREGGLDSQLADIEEFTNQLAKKTGDLFAGFDVFGPIKKKWTEFKGWFRSNLSPAFSVLPEVWNSTVGAVDWLAPFKTDQVRNAATKVWDTVKDVFNTGVEWGKNIWNLFKDDFQEIWKTITDAVKKAWEQIAPEIRSFADEFGGVAEVFRKTWNTLKPLVAILGGAFLGTLKLVTSVVANTLGPALDMIIAILKGLVRVIKGVVQLIVGIVTLDLGKALEGLASIFSGIWTIVWGILKNAGKVIWEIVKGIVEGIVDFFTWLWDVLVGHSIIPDMINAIIDWFASLPGKIWNAISSLGSKILEKVQEAWDWWVQKNEEMWSAIWEWFSGLAQSAWEALKEFAGKLKARAVEAWDAFKKAASDKWNAIINWIKTLGQSAWNAWVDIVHKTKNRATEAFQAFRTAAVNKWNEIVGWIKSLPGAAGNAIGGIVGTLKNKGTEAMNSMKNGITGAWGGVSSWLSGVGSRVKSAVGNLGSILYNTGKAILQGLLNGLKNKWNDVKNFLGGIAGQIPNIKGPIEKDRKILIDNGAAIMEGLEKGLAGKWPSVKSYLGSLAEAIVEAFSSRAGMGAGMYLKSVPLGYTRGEIANAGGRVYRAEVGAAPFAPTPVTKEVHLHFHGDLSFPNVRTSDDADKFISHLESLAGGDE